MNPTPATEIGPSFVHPAGEMNWMRPAILFLLSWGVSPFKVSLALRTTDTAVLIREWLPIEWYRLVAGLLQMRKRMDVNWTTMGPECQIPH